METASLLLLAAIRVTAPGSNGEPFPAPIEVVMSSAAPTPAEEAAPAEGAILPEQESSIPPGLREKVGRNLEMARSGLYCSGIVIPLVGASWGALGVWSGDEMRIDQYLGAGVVGLLGGSLLVAGDIALLGGSLTATSRLWQAGIPVPPAGGVVGAAAAAGQLVVLSSDDLPDGIRWPLFLALHGVTLAGGWVQIRVANRALEQPPLVAVIPVVLPTAPSGPGHTTYSSSGRSHAGIADAVVPGATLVIRW